ncbi:hypothetical protein Bbelb_013760 [Branchiostoma belcheri]|nr:hypothetical protein Bbelb_013760 [Branchiostoma belcheri]
MMTRHAVVFLDSSQHWESDDRSEKRRRPFGKATTVLRKGDDRSEKRRRPFGKATTVLRKGDDQKATTVRKGDDRSEKRRRPFGKATTVLRKGDDRSEKRRRPFVKATTVLRKGDDRSERRRPFTRRKFAPPPGFNYASGRCRHLLCVQCAVGILPKPCKTPTEKSGSDEILD